jgi:hypothetical protein
MRASEPDRNIVVTVSPVVMVDSCASMGARRTGLRVQGPKRRSDRAIYGDAGLCARTGAAAVLASNTGFRIQAVPGAVGAAIAVRMGADSDADTRCDEAGRRYPGC